jgi:hypothetical protein
MAKVISGMYRYQDRARACGRLMRASGFLARGARCHKASPVRRQQMTIAPVRFASRVARRGSISANASAGRGCRGSGCKPFLPMPIGDSWTSSCENMSLLETCLFGTNVKKIECTEILRDREEQMRQVAPIAALHQQRGQRGLMCVWSRWGCLFPVLGHRAKETGLPTKSTLRVRIRMELGGVRP